MTIAETLKSVGERGEMTLIAYYTAGFPTMEESIQNIRILAENGADMIEIGVPFSDPMADGAVIQQAAQKALEGGVTLKRIIEMIPKLKIAVPLLLMSYINPLMAYGRESLFKDARRVGVSGFIIPDLSMEESEEWVQTARVTGMDLVFLVAPTSSLKRIRWAAELSRGFLYCVSVTGTTGVREGLSSEIFQFIRKIKSQTNMPVAVGFGISTPEHVKRLWGHAEGVIVGSRFIQAVLQKENLPALVQAFKSATRKETP